MDNKITNREFVDAWVDAVNRKAGTKYVAEKLDRSVTAISVRATNLRQRGVNLPAMQYSKSDDTVEDLNARIERRLQVEV